MERKRKIRMLGNVRIRFTVSSGLVGRGFVTMFDVCIQALLVREATSTVDFGAIVWF